MIALDASALLALLFQEPGHEVVARWMDQACMTTVNLSEVLDRFVRDGHPAQGIMIRLRSSTMEWVGFDESLAVAAAELAPAARPLGLSLGDRACLALGRERGIPVLTADRLWLRLKVGIEVVCIR